MRRRLQTMALGAGMGALAVVVAACATEKAWVPSGAHLRSLAAACQFEEQSEAERQRACRGYEAYRQQADFREDRAECLAQAHQVRVPPAVAWCPSGDFGCHYARGRQIVEASEAEDARNTVFHGCMVGRGWSLQEKQE